MWATNWSCPTAVRTYCKEVTMATLSHALTRVRRPFQRAAPASATQTTVGPRTQDTLWGAYAASLLGCAPVVPIVAAASIAVTYVASLAPAKVPHPTLAGTLVALGAWLVAALLY